MGNVYAIGDLHFRHNALSTLQPERLGTNFGCAEEHDEILLERINSRVSKRDVLWVLGDVAFNREGLDLVQHIRCSYKFLVIGNHDRFPTDVYLEYFDRVYGLVKRYGVWLSHAPIHPQELRGSRNIHGHVHAKTVTDCRGALDWNYINACVEATQGYPIDLKTIRGA